MNANDEREARRALAERLRLVRLKMEQQAFFNHCYREAIRMVADAIWRRRPGPLEYHNLFRDQLSVLHTPEPWEPRPVAVEAEP